MKEVNRLRQKIQSIAKREEGQALVEYSLILALVSVAAIAALGFLSGDINGVFQTVYTALPGGN
jgi:pilus assembly protein Flp/PilA